MPEKASLPKPALPMFQPVPPWSTIWSGLCDLRVWLVIALSVLATSFIQVIQIPVVGGDLCQTATMLLKMNSPDLFARDFLYHSADPIKFYTPFVRWWTSLFLTPEGGLSYWTLVYTNLQMFVFAMGVYTMVMAFSGEKLLAVGLALAAINPLEPVRFPLYIPSTFVLAFVPWLFTLFLYQYDSRRLPWFFLAVGVVANFHPGTSLMFLQGTLIAAVFLNGLGPRMLGRYLLCGLLWMVGASPFLWHYLGTVGFVQGEVLSLTQLWPMIEARAPSYFFPYLTVPFGASTQYLLAYGYLALYAFLALYRWLHGRKAGGQSGGLDIYWHLMLWAHIPAAIIVERRFNVGILAWLSLGLALLLYCRDGVTRRDRVTISLLAGGFVAMFLGGWASRVLSDLMDRALPNFIEQYRAGYAVFKPALVLLAARALLAAAQWAREKFGHLKAFSYYGLIAFLLVAGHPLFNASWPWTFNRVASHTTLGVKLFLAGMGVYFLVWLFERMAPKWKRISLGALTAALAAATLYSGVQAYNVSQLMGGRVSWVPGSEVAWTPELNQALAARPSWLTGRDFHELVRWAKRSTKPDDLIFFWEPELRYYARRSATGSWDDGIFALIGDQSLIPFWMERWSTWRSVRRRPDTGSFLKWARKDGVDYMVIGPGWTKLNMPVAYHNPSFTVYKLKSG